LKNYNIFDALCVIDRIKNNPYGIREGFHYKQNAYTRNIDINVVNQKLLNSIPVGIQKTKYFFNKFELIYEYNNKEDLYVVVEIINSDEIVIVTIISKKVIGECINEFF